MKNRHVKQMLALVLATMMLGSEANVLAAGNETVAESAESGSTVTDGSEQNGNTETDNQNETASDTAQPESSAETGLTEDANAGDASGENNVQADSEKSAEEENVQEVSAESAEEEEETPVEISDLVVNIGANETQVNVTWYSTSSDAGTLQIARKSEVRNGEFPRRCSTYTAAVTNSQTGEFINKVTITDLHSSTEYVYRIYDGEKWSDTYTYTTKQFNSSFSFLMMGDPQIGCSGSVEGDSEGWLTTLQNSLSSFPGTAFVYSMGDQINAYYDKTNTEKVEEEYTGFLSSLEDISDVALATTVGNHDAGRDAALYSEHFTTPNSTSYGDVTSSSETDYDGDYYFTYNGTLFMNLESNNLSIAEHKAFMEEAISANPNATWKVVTYHKSTYSVASHVTESDIVTLRTGLSPIFKELGIDLVLQGHDHVYARSYIMGGDDGMTADTTTGGSDIYGPDGVLYVTANSASGSKYYNITSEAFTYTAVMNQEKVPNYTNVEINQDSFTVTTYRSTDNSVVDTVTVHKQEQKQEQKKEQKKAPTKTKTDKKSSKVTKNSPKTTSKKNKKY